MSVNELILNKEEMERLLVDALPQSGDNKSEAVKWLDDHLNDWSMGSERMDDRYVNHF